MKVYTRYILFIWILLFVQCSQANKDKVSVIIDFEGKEQYDVIVYLPSHYCYSCFNQSIKSLNQLESKGLNNAAIILDCSTQQRICENLAKEISLKVDFKDPEALTFFQDPMKKKEPFYLLKNENYAIQWSIY